MPRINLVRQSQTLWVLSGRFAFVVVIVLFVGGSRKTPLGLNTTSLFGLRSYGRAGKLLKSRIFSQRIKHRIEPEQGRRERYI